MRKEPLELSPTDRHYLEALLRKGTMGVKQFKRATALLELDRGQPITAIAETLKVSRGAVSRWAKRYRQQRVRLKGLGYWRRGPI